MLGWMTGPGSPDWCGLAAEYGYADQAHLIRDFRDLTGLTTTEYRPRSAEVQNHVPVESSAADTFLQYSGGWVIL
jgi:hypothetical protein